MLANLFLQGLISFLIVAFGHPNFAPYLAPLAASFGYALFWKAISIYPFSKQRFWRSAVWFSAISLVQLCWMSAIEYQGLYILVVWIALSVWLGAQFGLLSLLIPHNRKLSWGRILAIASFWTFFEWCRYYVLCGYSWNLSGLALSPYCSLQFATLFGVLGLTFWVILTNLAILRAFFRKGIPSYVLWAAIAIFPYAFGAFHTGYHQKKMEGIKGSAPFSCLLVQTGLLPSEKIPLRGKIRSFVPAYEQWRRILIHVRDHASIGPDLIVLPEETVPFDSGKSVYDPKVVHQIFASVFGELPLASFPDGKEEKGGVSNLYWAKTLARHLKSEVVVGFDHIDSRGNSYNSAFYLRPDTEKIERYDKRVLVPLAEYLPLRFLLPLVKSYGITGFCTHGKEAKIFEGKVPMSVSICYEETFPHKIREGRANGAELLVNLTNDGWYPFSRLSGEHFEHARIRAVENGVPLVRACNNGVTAAINSLGKTMGRMEETLDDRKLQAGALFTTFIPYSYRTLFTFWGNGGILALCLLFSTLFLSLRKAYNL